MSGEESILSSTNLWYSVAFAAFFILLFAKGRTGIVGSIDAQIAQIRHELDEAKRLRAEAEQTLADYQKRQAEAMQEAEAIVAEAKALAARLRKESEIELENTLKRHEQMAVDRIQMIQEEAAADVRRYFVNEAMQQAQAKLQKNVEAAETKNLVDAIIADLPSIVKGKTA